MVTVPGTRDWPVLRELVFRASTDRPCPELVRAVADSPSPVQAWKERWRDLHGPRRLAMFSHALDGTVDGFVAAYLDGDIERQVVIVRHFVTASTEQDPRGAEAGRALLQAVEAWADQQSVPEVLMEVAGDDTATQTLLQARGYRATGVTRPGFDAVGGDIDGTSVATEWGLELARSETRAPIFAVAS